MANYGSMCDLCLSLNLTPLDLLNLSQWIGFLDNMNDTSGYESANGTMFTETLSTRQELVENLDTEPLFDYLRQHGVLDNVTESQIRTEEKRADRNRALLQHLDSHGNIAIGLFINALRQSGQLQLASSLDVTNRIQPIYGTGYWQKPRHKGQIAIEIQVLAVKTVLDKPPKSKDEFDGKDQNMRDQSNLVNQSLDRWISVEDVRNAMETGPSGLSPRSRAYYKSFENMTILEQPEQTPSPRVRKIQQFAYGDDEDEVKKKSCFCLCLPKLFGHKKKKKKSLPQCYIQPQRKASNPYDLSRSPSRGSRSSRQGSMKRQLFSDRENAETANSSPQQDFVNRKNHINQQQQEENHNELDNERKAKQSLDSSVILSQGSSDAIDGIEEWISSVDILKETSRRFYSLFNSECDSPQTQLLKYFEQERGMLTLETNTNDRLVVITICMRKEQLEKLQKDFEDGTLQHELENYLLTLKVLDAVGVNGLQLDVRIDSEQFKLVQQELM